MLYVLYRWRFTNDHVTKVFIDGDFSDDHVMNYSLPQRSIIGPPGSAPMGLYYILPLLAISYVLFNISFYAYADDLQLCAEFDPRSAGDCEGVLARLSCIDVINEWMIQSKPQLNQDKTEFFCYCK